MWNKEIPLKIQPEQIKSLVDERWQFTLESPSAGIFQGRCIDYKILKDEKSIDITWLERGKKRVVTIVFTKWIIAENVVHFLTDIPGEKGSFINDPSRE